MLTEDLLREAVQAGVKASACCTRFCVVGASVDNDCYHLWHNGVSNPPGAEQVIHSSEVLGWTAVKLGERITVWVAGLHRGERVDLNVT